MDFSEYRFLVLDDHSMISQMITSVLYKLGVNQVDIANDGEAGLGIIAAGHMPDIIISDLNMPNLDGIELITSLADMNFSGGLIIVSGSDDCMLRIGSNMAKNRHINILGTLAKPFTAQKLIEMLQRYAQPRSNIA